MSATHENALTGLYVYGVVPDDADLPLGLTGIDGASVNKLGDGAHAAVVTEIEDAEGLGTPEDLLAHSHVLDTIAASGPILPMAFATVVADAATIVEEVLPSMHDEYEAGLRRVDGAVQYALRARYVQQELLSEFIANNPDIAALRESTADRSEDESHYDRIRLGERVVEEFERAAAVDSADILDHLRTVVREVASRETAQADDVLEVAVLVDRKRQEALERMLETMATNEQGRINFRLLGPQAPYDFVREV